MAVKSSRDELHKLFQQRTGFAEAPIDYTKYSNKQVSTSRQLSARQQQDEYRIAMRRLGYEFSTDSTYKPEDGEERLSPSYTFTTGQQRDAQASIKELMEKYRQQDEYRKESRELQPLDRTALMPKDTAGLSPEILRSEVASGVRDWQAYDLAKKELDTKYPDRIYRKPTEAKIEKTVTEEAPKEKTNFFKAVGNSLLAGIINMARQTVSNAPSLAGGATPEQEEKTRQAIQKIIDVTTPKEDQSIKPIWQGSFERQAESMARVPGVTKVLAGASEAVQKTPERTEKYLSSQEQAARKRADLANASRATRLFAGAAESLPLSLATRIPYLGWVLMANTSFKNSLEQSVLDMPNPTEEQANMMMIKAIGDAALEVGTEMIFPLYGSASATVKGMAKGTIKPTLANATKGLIGMFKKGAVEVITPTIKNVSKQIIKQAGEESLEEGINYVLGAYLAVLTTEQGKNVWGDKDGKESIATLAGLIDAMAVGGISGGGMTATRFAMPTAGYYYQNFQNTREVIDDIGDKTIDEITTEDAKKINDAIVEDMNVPENAEAVIKTVVDAVEKGTPIAPEVPTTEDFDAVLQKDISQLKEKMTRLSELMKPAEAPTRPSERVQEPEASVPSEEPVIAPAQSQDATQAQEAPVEQAPVEKPVKKEAPDVIARGDVIRSSVSAKESIDARVNVLTAKTIIPSMDADMNPVTEYDKVLQPRDIKRKGSEKLVYDIAANPNFQDLFRTETIAEGIPVVDYRGMVVAGNHRVAGILKMMRDFPNNYQAYKQYAIDNADKYGLNKESLKGDFIVTRMLPEETNAKDIADKTNIPAVRKMSPSELARRDSSMLDKRTIDFFVPREDGMINTVDNRDFLLAYASNIIPEAELDSYLDSKGNWNTAGIQRITNALFYKAYGSTKLLDLIAESTDNDVRRLTTSLVNVSPSIVAYDEGVKGGAYHDLPIGTLISASAEQWVRMKQAKQNVMLFANQTEMGDTPDTIRAKNMMFAMDANKRSAKALTSFYNDIINAAKATGSPGQISLFASEKPSIDSIIEVAKRRGNIDVTQIEIQPETRIVSDEEVVGTRQERQTEVKEEPKVETKAELTPKAQAEEAYEDVVAKASSAQDVTGRLNIVPPMFQTPAQPAQPAKKQERMIDYKGVEDEKVRAEFDKAKRPIVSDGKPLVVRIRDSITRNFLRASVPEVGFEQGQVRTDIRKLRQRFSITATQTWEEIKGIYNPIGKDYKTQMDYAVFLPDLVEDINLGKYDNNRQLPFSFKNVQQVIDENDRIQRLIQDTMDTTIKSALDRRRKIYLANQKKVNDLAEKLDVDFSGYFSRQDYVHHAIMEYMDNAMNNPDLKRSAINILRRREGGQKAYITDSTLADFLALQKLKEMQLKLEALQTLKEMDITDTLEIDEDGKRIIKDGYIEVDSTLVRFTFPDEMLKTQAVNTANAFIDKFKLDRESPAARKLLSEANKTHRNTHYIVPVDVADAYANMFKSKGYANDFDEVYMKVMGAWKAYALMAPRRAFTYQLRNSISDFSKTFGFMPKAISYVPKATSMLTKYMLGVETSADLLRYIGAGGLEGGITNIELGDYKSLDKLNVYDSKGQLKPLSQIITAITKPLNGMENFYQWREQIFRFAGYMYFYHEGLNKNNLPKDGDYRASKRAEIQSIRSRSDVAYKMSNDIVGAYDDTTPFTQFISRRLQPFFRFQETNNKAYFRGLLNTFYNDPNLIKEVGEKTASRFAKGVKLSAYTAMRLGKFAIMASLVDLVLSVWNRVFRKEEDEQVPSYAREESHITVGKWGNKIYYLSNVGSLREALEWVGMSDPYQDFYDIATGKKTYEQKVLEIIKAPGLRMTESIAPLLTPIVELKTGQKMYSGQYIRDDWEYVAEFFQLKPAYRALTGKPQIDGKFNWNPISLQKAFENEAYFWDIYDLRDQYYISQGREPLPPYPPSTEARSKALYQFRTAIRYNDSEAAKRYLELYMAENGTLNGVKASARAITPLQGMTKADREAFVASLTGHDKYVYEKGMEFYAKYADDMIKFAEKYMD